MSSRVAARQFERGFAAMMSIYHAAWLGDATTNRPLWRTVATWR